MNDKNQSIKKYKPTTPSLRQRSILIRNKKRLKLKTLSYNYKYNAGRNINGRITNRHKGGRHKRIYRKIDIKRNIASYSLLYNLIKEYDPNRKTNILRVYTNQFKLFYINNCENQTFNSYIINKYTNLDNIYTNNDNFKLKNIPIGYKIFNIQPNNLIKSAGTYGTIISKKNNMIKIKLPSKQIININNNATANIGINDNINHNLTNYGKAGAKRWLGIRPTVKGNAMNAVDHPHGGNTKGGNAMPRTKWGKNAKWIKTKKKN